MSQDVDARAVRSLTRRYVVVYALATFGDWIQGAYLYAAYRGHGLAKREIGCVYVLGYAVSATIGTAVAAMGDGHGHKRLAEAYGWLVRFLIFVPATVQAANGGGSRLVH